MKLTTRDGKNKTPGQKKTRNELRWGEAGPEKNKYMPNMKMNG